MSRLISPHALLSASSITIGDYLRANSHEVPDYQRDYEWGSDELSKLWEDLVRAVDRSFPGGSLGAAPEGHFLGAIVTQQPSSGATALEVIDGQQRLSTLSMLVSVLYEFANAIVDVNVRTNVIMQLLPLIANTHAQGRTPRLKLAREQDFFDKSVVQNLTMTERSAYWATVQFDKYPVRNRIRTAIQFLHAEVIADRAKSSTSADVRLTNLVEGVTELFMVLHMNVSDHNMAYRVFETLNFRGLALSQADLIKNELVRRGTAQGVRTDVVGDWLEINKSLDRIKQISLVEFLQFHYASSRGPVRASDLFESVVGLLDSKPLTARQYTEELVAESARLVQIVEGDTSVWSSAANDALDDIRETLGVKFAYPLLMAAAARFTGSPGDFNTWARRVRDFCFRYFTIGRTPLGKFASTVTEAARKLRDTSQSDSSVLTDLQKASPDAKFEDDFAKFAVSTNKLGFYVIKCIEDHISVGAGKTFPQGPTQHLEHIMPKKPGTGWNHVSTSPLYDSYVARIGNLLGLEAAINSHIQNKAYTYKVSNESGLDYSHSAFSLPSATGTHLNASGDWDFSSIEARQAELAKLYAREVWPLN